MTIRTDAVETAKEDVMDYFWAQCGAAAWFDGFLLILGFVGTVNRDCAWTILVFTMVMTLGGLLFGCCVASNKSASETENSWRVSRVREINSCFLVTIISAGLIWVMMQSMGGDEFVQYLEVTQVLPDGSLSWSYPAWSSDLHINSFDPIVEALLRDGVTVAAVGEEEFPARLVIGGVRYDCDTLGDPSPSSTFFAKFYGDSHKTIHLHDGTIARGPEDALIVTEASKLYLRMVHQDLEDARMVFVQASTAQFINFIDFIVDVLSTCFLPFPALLVGIIQDYVLPERLKDMIGLKLSWVIIAMTTIMAIFYGLTQPTGCPGLCFLLSLGPFILIISGLSCAFAKFYMNTKTYPGKLTKHDGFDAMHPVESMKDMGFCGA